MISVLLSANRFGSFTPTWLRSRSVSRSVIGLRGACAVSTWGGSGSSHSKFSQGKGIFCLGNEAVISTDGDEGKLVGTLHDASIINTKKRTVRLFIISDFLIARQN